MANDWHSDFLDASLFALHREDLRLRYTYARRLSDLSTTPGIANAMETAAVLSIYEALVGKGFGPDAYTVNHEHPYPNVKATNGKRADIALKLNGKGQKWQYVEAKYWNPRYINNDIRKLKGLKLKAQRCMFIYLVRSTGTKTHSLSRLAGKLGPLSFSAASIRSFETPTVKGAPGICELLLASVK